VAHQWISGAAANRDRAAACSDDCYAGLPRTGLPQARRRRKRGSSSSPLCWLMVSTGRQAMAAARARPIPAPTTLSANPRCPGQKALVTAAASAEDAPPAIPVTQVIGRRPVSQQPADPRG
jgi:hypothetical protein